MSVHWVDTKYERVFILFWGRILLLLSRLKVIISLVHMNMDENTKVLTFYQSSKGYYKADLIFTLSSACSLFHIKIQYRKKIILVLISSIWIQTLSTKILQFWSQLWEKSSNSSFICHNYRFYSPIHICQ